MLSLMIANIRAFNEPVMKLENKIVYGSELNRGQYDLLLSDGKETERILHSSVMYILEASNRFAKFYVITLSSTSECRVVIS